MSRRDIIESILLCLFVILFCWGAFALLIHFLKPKVEPPLSGYDPLQVQEPFLYAYVPHAYPKRVVRAVVTAYNPAPEQTDDTPHITASGEKVREGIVACPIWLEFGTIIEIDGKLYECQDRMHPKYWYQNRFDILMWDYWEARRFGKRIKEVKIYH